MQIKKCITPLLLLFSLNVSAQFSILQNGEGESSLIVFGGNEISVNTKSNTIALSVSPKKISNNKKYSFIANAAFNTKDNLTYLLKNNTTQLGGKLGGLLTINHSEFNEDNSFFIYQYIGLVANLNQNNLIDTTALFDKQLTNDYGYGIRLNYGWNLLNVKFDHSILKLLGEFTSGLSFSIGSTDNRNRLESIEIQTLIKSFNNGAITRNIVKSQNAIYKQDFKKQQCFATLNFDFAKYICKSRLLANLHLNYSIYEDDKPMFNPALGIFLMAERAPLEAILGIQFQTTDWFNGNNSSKSKIERSAIVLTVGFPFN